MHWVTEFLFPRGPCSPSTLEKILVWVVAALPAFYLVLMSPLRSIGWKRGMAHSGVHEHQIKFPWSDPHHLTQLCADHKEHPRLIARLKYGFYIQINCSNSVSWKWSTFSLLICFLEGWQNWCTACYLLLFAMWGKMLVLLLCFLASFVLTCRSLNHVSFNISF